jgi:hypothetical protein
MNAVNELSEDQNREIYFEGVKKVGTQVGKCIGVEGDHIEQLGH